MKPYILAYVMDRNLIKVTPDDAKRLTHINLAFGKVTPEGLLDESGLQHIDYIETIREWNPSLKFVLSVGGWGAGNFSTMAMTEKGRRDFCASCLKYVEAHRLDGIDIDWEYPCSDSAGIDADPSDKEHFTLLLQELRNVLGNDRIVSIAAGAGAYFIRDTEMDRVAEICDYVQLMTYDMRSGFSSEAGHHTSLFAGKGDTSGNNTKDTVKRFHEAGVPYENIIIGGAFYARRWDGVRDIGHGLLQPAETIGQSGPRYHEIAADYIGKNGWVKYWDEEACAPYLFNGSSLISYDDPRSLACKCRYLQEAGLLGIMFWELGSDDTHTLLKTIADTLR